MIPTDAIATRLNLHEPLVRMTPSYFRSIAASVFLFWVGMAFHVGLTWQLDLVFLSQSLCFVFLSTLERVPTLTGPYVTLVSANVVITIVTYMVGDVFMSGHYLYVIAAGGIILFPVSEWKHSATVFFISFATACVCHFMTRFTQPVLGVRSSAVMDVVNLAALCLAAYITVLTPVRVCLRMNAELAMKMLEMQKLQTRAEEASKAKSNFLAMMSHEIRTPLNGVLGMTQVLQAGRLEPDQKEIVDTIRLSGEALLTIINDVLDSSKLEAGKVDFEHVPFSIVSVAEEAVVAVSSLVKGGNVQLICDVFPDIPCVVIGDPLRIRQCLWNLLSNGLKFTDKGRVVLRLKMLGSRVSEDGINSVADLRVEVEDEGIGMDPDTISRLFKPFSQFSHSVKGENSTTRRYGGTGLGLYICQQLLEGMGSCMKVTSRVGAGSIFSFDINLPVANGLHVNGSHSAGSAHLGHSGLTDGMTAVAIDRDSHHQAALSHLMSRLGWSLLFEDTPAVLFQIPFASEIIQDGCKVVLLDWASVSELHPEDLASALTRINLPVVIFTQPSLVVPPNVELLAARMLRRPICQRALAEAIDTALKGSFTPKVLKIKNGMLDSRCLAGQSLYRCSSTSCLVELQQNDDRFRLPDGSSNHKTGLRRSLGADSATSGQESIVPVMPSPCTVTPPDFTAAVRHHGARVLVAEDNAVNVAVLKRMLGQLGVQYDICLNGADAVTKYKSAQVGFYGLCLFDIHMPDLDGFEATKMIRKLEAGSGSHLPVIACTASAMEADRLLCLQAGMNDLLIKPLGLQRLKLCLDTWMKVAA